MPLDFKIVETDFNNVVTINVHTQINNLHADEVTVSENVNARLYGKINKSLTIRKGAVVILHGTFHGVINNEGGEFTNYQANTEG